MDSANPTIFFQALLCIYCIETLIQHWVLTNLNTSLQADSWQNSWTWSLVPDSERQGRGSTRASNERDKDQEGFDVYVEKTWGVGILSVH